MNAVAMSIYELLHVQMLIHRLGGFKIEMTGTEAESRKRDIDEFGSHTHFPESKEMSPEKTCLAHSPVSSSSFNKGFFDNEETLHREIIRDLGVSFAEITTTEDNNASADINSRITSTSAGVMGMKSMEP